MLPSHTEYGVTLGSLPPSAVTTLYSAFTPYIKNGFCTKRAITTTSLLPAPGRIRTHRLPPLPSSHVLEYAFDNLDLP